MVQQVSDFLSNANEHIMEAVDAIRRSADARAVFVAIHTGKRAVKTVRELAEAAGLSEKVVLTHGKKFADLHLIEQMPMKVRRRTAYRKNSALQKKKQMILSLAEKPAKREAYATKRQANVTITVRNGRGATRPKAVHVTLDNIESFSRVVGIETKDFIPRTVSEDHFKRGVQAIVGEPGEWKDWGGELYDFATTRLRIRGNRVAAVFAFKGPGKRGPLVPGKMGTNGDQVQRMFYADARAFFVQYHEDIKPSILQLLRACAVDKSDATNQPIFYGTLDGKDSHRLLLAYPQEFANGARKLKSKKRPGVR